MPYLLIILLSVAIVMIQTLLIVLKLTGAFAAGWVAILIPTWFVCAFIVGAVLIWLFALFC